MTGHGGLVEKIVVPAKSAIPLPAERSFEEGSALLLTYATVDPRTVSTAASSRPARRLLVLGAAGGVGLAAVETRQGIGARVIGAASPARTRPRRRARPAPTRRSSIRAGRSTRSAKALSQLFKDAVGPRGADVIYDPVGGDYAEPALRASRGKAAI